MVTPGFEDYWRGLRGQRRHRGGRLEQAYFGKFSGAGGGEGTHPMVVSYATSPVAEVVFPDPPITVPPTRVLTDTCYRHIEFAGILRGTEHEAAAQQLVDFLLSQPLQGTSRCGCSSTRIDGGDAAGGVPAERRRRDAPQPALPRRGGGAPSRLGRAVVRPDGTVSRRARIAILAVPIAFLLVSSCSRSYRSPGKGWPRIAPPGPAPAPHVICHPWQARPPPC